MAFLQVGRGGSYFPVRVRADVLCLRQKIKRCAGVDGFLTLNPPLEQLPPPGIELPVQCGNQGKRFRCQYLRKRRRKLAFQFYSIRESIGHWLPSIFSCQLFIWKTHTSQCRMVPSNFPQQIERQPEGIYDSE
jgi:hypothetical protein